MFELTEKPVQFDDVQVEVLHQAVDVEEVAHEGHQGVTCSSQSRGRDCRRSQRVEPLWGAGLFNSPFVRRSKRKMSKFHVPTLESICCHDKGGGTIRE